MASLTRRQIRDLTASVDRAVEGLRQRAAPIAKFTSTLPPADSTTPEELKKARAELAAVTAEFTKGADETFTRPLTEVREELAALKQRTFEPFVPALLVGLLLAAAAVPWYAKASAHRVPTPSTTTAQAATPAPGTAVRLTSADLRGARFVNVDLSGVDLRNACLMNARFESVRLDRTQLDGADLRGAEFVGTDVSVTTGSFVIDVRTRFGSGSAPKGAVPYDGKTTPPCDLGRP